MQLLPDSGPEVLSLYNCPDTSKPAAKALEAKGVETVTASFDDAGSLKAAMKDVYAVFAMTN
jgi:hypothetical protein